MIHRRKQVIEAVRFRLHEQNLSRRRDASARTAEQGRALRLAAILLCLCSGLTHVTPWIIGQSGEVAYAASHLWRIEDLRGTTVVMLLFTMCFTSLLAGLRLATDGTDR